MSTVALGPAASLRSGDIPGQGLGTGDSIARIARTSSLDSITEIAVIAAHGDSCTIIAS